MEREHLRKFSKESYGGFQGRVIKEYILYDN